MSENIKAVPADAEIVDEPTTAIVVDWKALGKKIAIYGGILAAGLTVGYVLAQPADEIDVSDEDTETDSTEETPEV